MLGHGRLFAAFPRLNQGRANMSNDTPTNPILPIAVPGVISPNELYHLTEFKRRLGWGDHAMRVARRNGLKVQYIAGRAYVFGADGIDHIRSHAKSAK
jgi:hypothetical protein